MHIFPQSLNILYFSFVIGRPGLNGPQGIRGRTGMRGLKGAQGRPGLQGFKGFGGTEYNHSTPLFDYFCNLFNHFHLIYLFTGSAGIDGEAGRDGPKGQKGMEFSSIHNIQILQSSGQ